MEAKTVAKGVEDVKNVEVSIVTANIDENVENEPALIDDVALAGKLKNVELLDNVIDALDTTKTCVVSAEVGCHGSEDVEHAAPADTIVDEIKVATEIVDALNAIGGYINIAEPATDNQIARPNLLDELLQLDDVIGAIENIEPFDCEICLDTIEPKNGIVLRECLHSFCKVCISESVAHDFNVTAKCPSPDCDFHLQEREIRAIVSVNIYHHYMLKGVRAAQSTIRGAVLCSLPDCDGWYICDDTINQFQCPTCQQPNCIPCQVSFHINCVKFLGDFIKPFILLLLSAEGHSCGTQLQGVSRGLCIRRS